MEDFILCQTHAPSLAFGGRFLPGAPGSGSSPHPGSAPDTQAPGKCQILHPRDAVGWTQWWRVGGCPAPSLVGTKRQTSPLQEGKGIDSAVWGPNSWSICPESLSCWTSNYVKDLTGWFFFQLLLVNSNWHANKNRNRFYASWNAMEQLYY